MGRSSCFDIMKLLDGEVSMFQNNETDGEGRSSCFKIIKLFDGEILMFQNNETI